MCKLNKGHKLPAKQISHESNLYEPILCTSSVITEISKSVKIMIETYIFAESRLLMIPLTRNMHVITNNKNGDFHFKA